MAVTMIFYSNFSKRDNSTKVPTGGTSESIVFKGDFDITGGVVTIHQSFNVAINYTAAKYGKYYYFVDNVTSANGTIVDITLRLDVLATYKSEVSGYTGLLERSPAETMKPLLADNTVFPTNYTQVKLLGSASPSLVKYWRVLVNNNSGGMGYYFDSTNMANFLLGLESSIFIDRNLITGISAAPVPLSAIQAVYPATSDIRVGSTAIPGVSGYKINGASETIICSGSVVLSDSLFMYSDSRRGRGEFTQLAAEICGSLITLDSMYNKFSSISFQTECDLITHDTYTTIKAHKGDASYIVGSASNNVGVSFGYGTHVDGLQGALSALNAGFNTALSTGNALAGALSATIPMANVGANLGQTVGTPGGNSIAPIYAGVKLYLIEHGTTEPNPAENGYPYMMVNKPATLGAGYYKYVKANLDVNAHKTVRETLDSYLNTGFYYE